MVKRSISEASADLASDDDYAMAPPTPKAAKSSKAKRLPAQKKLKTKASDGGCPEQADEGAASQCRLHTSATHIISAPEPLRVALLEWYAGVHETRGMPWRKPYDSTLGRDGRAQRAYEVSMMPFRYNIAPDLSCRPRSGYRKSCYSRPRLQL
jgi:A/G-specific adenine glycosylase